MDKASRNENTKLNAIIDSVINDIQEMPDEEALLLAVEAFGGIEQVIAKFNSIVEQAESVAKIRRLESAQEKLREARESSRTFGIVNLPVDRKKQILKIAQSNGHITTLAARNLINSDADIDNMLEDLVELGVIDEHGNPL